MIVFRISKCKYIDDTSGYGAFANGGRWNSVGVHLLYTSQSASLALLETLAHLPSYLVPDEYCLLTLEVPDKLIQKLEPKNLPMDWNEFPNTYSTQKIGDEFVRSNKQLALRVPSCIVELDYNILINPRSIHFDKLKIITKKTIVIDKRLV